MLLRKIFPGPDMNVAKIRSDLASDHLVAETFRNFAYPLQDWASFLDPMGLYMSSPEFLRIRAAQEIYVERLKTLAENF